MLTVAVAAPFGLALSAVLPRELEGTLVPLIVVGLQMMTLTALVALASGVRLRRRSHLRLSSAG